MKMSLPNKKNFLILLILIITILPFSAFSQEYPYYTPPSNNVDYPRANHQNVKNGQVQQMP